MCKLNKSLYIRLLDWWTKHEDIVLVLVLLAAVLLSHTLRG